MPKRMVAGGLYLALFPACHAWLACLLSPFYAVLTPFNRTYLHSKLDRHCLNSFWNNRIFILFMTKICMTLNNDVRSVKRRQQNHDWHAGNIVQGHIMKIINVRLFQKLFKQCQIKFAVKIVRLKVNIIFSSPMILLFAQGHNCVSNLTHFYLVL